MGWKTNAVPPSVEKYVLVGAHHTSNWDFPLALVSMRAMGIPFNWVAKHTLFIPPLGSLFRCMGGVPVDRTAPHGFVDEAIGLFDTHDALVLAIAPDGTRSKVNFWKTGFYHIALKARVPIAFGYLDYKTKTAGVVEGFIPSGDIESDMHVIREFYIHIQGKFPECVSDVVLRKERC